MSLPAKVDHAFRDVCSTLRDTPRVEDHRVTGQNKLDPWVTTQRIVAQLGTSAQTLHESFVSWACLSLDLHIAYSNTLPSYIFFGSYYLSSTILDVTGAKINETVPALKISQSRERNPCIC